MGARAEKGVELFKQGYNCSQSVFAAFADIYGIDTETALRISSAFGGGMGRLRQVCGAVSGMAMVCGMQNGPTDAKNQTEKSINYSEFRALAARFQEQNGSIVCRQLLGIADMQVETSLPSERSPEYYQKRPCLELVRSACEILERSYFPEEA